MFFEQSRVQFFKPLTSKYREQIVECLSELYRRLYSSSSADYGHALSREDVIDTFSASLVRAPVLAEEEPDTPSESRFRTTRDQAGWVLNQLLEFGWLEKQVDEATLQSSYNFTRYGRLLSELMTENDASSVRTRHRNTRNVRNALSSFLDEGEVYDLLDAWEFSEKIISDFTDIIAELDDRKRAMVQQMEGQIQIQQASSDFFDFMEQRFQPDLAIRLSADNVEKYRADIVEIIRRIRTSDNRFKQAAERRLRELLPNLVRVNESVLWQVLDSIETRLQAAGDIMLPALRRSLQGFTKRADIIIRQMNYLATSSHNDVVQVCQTLSSKPEHEQDTLLQKAAQQMSVPNLGFLDPAHVRLQQRSKKRVFDLGVNEDNNTQIDHETYREQMVQQALDQAFYIHDNAVREYLVKHLLAGEAVTTSELTVKSASDLLAMSHAIEVGSAQGQHSDIRFSVDYVGDQVSDHPYFTQQDVFQIRLLENTDFGDPNVSRD